MYDTNCKDLAQYFLNDDNPTPARVEELSQAIQDAIEAWFSKPAPVPEGHCGLCGEPMPAGEEMFKFHGYSGNCPKPPLSKSESA